MLKDLGAETTEREGSRVAIVMNGEVHVQHKPHPSPCMDKGAVADLYLERPQITIFRWP